MSSYTDQIASQTASDPLIGTITLIAIATPTLVRDPVEAEPVSGTRLTFNQRVRNALAEFESEAIEENFSAGGSFGEPFEAEGVFLGGQPELFLQRLDERIHTITADKSVAAAAMLNIIRSQGFPSRVREEIRRLEQAANDRSIMDDLEAGSPVLTGACTQDRPVPGNEGTVYNSLEERRIWRDDGTQWVEQAQHIGSVTDFLVQTSSVNDNAITANASSVTAGSSTIDTTERIFNTASITSTGAEVGVWATATLRNVAGNSPTLMLRKDNVTGTILFTASPRPPVGDDEAFSVSLMGVDTSPSASQDYVLTGDTGNADGDILERQIFAVNFKK